MVPRHPSVGGSPKDARKIAEVAVRHQIVGGPPNDARKIAEVAELAYAQVSEACAARLEGSTPSFRTILK